MKDKLVKIALVAFIIMCSVITLTHLLTVSSTEVKADNRYGNYNSPVSTQDIYRNGEHFVIFKTAGDIEVVKL
jgi:hypothetical protein